MTEAHAELSAPRYTIFVPTFNRAHTIAAAIRSADAQSYRGFEILVIDDGSDDGTEGLVNRVADEISAPLRYHWQENQGKHVAYNTCASLARGEFVVLLDSDDTLLPEALQTIDDAWEAILVADRHEFAGVEGLCRTSSGDLHGTAFPRDVFDSDYLASRRVYGVTGEKRHSLRTDILRRHPYPVIPGERHVRPDYIWKQIAHGYRFRYINRVLQIVDFRRDGLTRNARLRRLRNPGGLYLYYRDEVLNHPVYLTMRDRRKACSQYVRYALRYGIGLRHQRREIQDAGLWLAALPRGLQDWLLDSAKASRYRGALTGGDVRPKASR